MNQIRLFNSFHLTYQPNNNLWTRSGRSDIYLLTHYNIYIYISVEVIGFYYVVFKVLQKLKDMFVIILILFYKLNSFNTNKKIYI